MVTMASQLVNVAADTEPQSDVQDEKENPTSFIIECSSATAAETDIEDEDGDSFIEEEVSIVDSDKGETIYPEGTTIQDEGDIYDEITVENDDESLYQEEEQEIVVEEEVEEMVEIEVKLVPLHASSVSHLISQFSPTSVVERQNKKSPARTVGKLSAWKKIPALLEEDPAMEPERLQIQEERATPSQAEATVEANTKIRLGEADTPKVQSNNAKSPEKGCRAKQMTTDRTLDGTKNDENQKEDAVVDDVSIPKTNNRPLSFGKDHHRGDEKTFSSADNTGKDELDKITSAMAVAALNSAMLPSTSPKKHKSSFPIEGVKISEVKINPASSHKTKPCIKPNRLSIPSVFSASNQKASETKQESVQTHNTVEMFAVPVTSSASFVPKKPSDRVPSAFRTAWTSKPEEKETVHSNIPEILNSLPEEDGNGPYYSLEDLQNGKTIDGVDIRKREQHLSPSDFFRYFQMTKDEFAKQPKWKKDKAKRSLMLF